MYSNTYIRNLKKKKKKMLVTNQGQDRNNDADIENGLEDTGRWKGKPG